ncbi:protein TolA [Paracoccus sp. NSM]|uniref:protein TolA n=1 Tax=Paracoccus sp. NSM TaxID=3457784 RepID=UPI004035A83A
MSEREERIGRWVSGVAHGSLILWAVLGGALFRPQTMPPMRSTQVSTISGAEFEALAAASRGAGPVAPDATAVASLPTPSGDEGAEAPAGSTAPEAQDVAELAPPDSAEPAPDLSDFAARDPVAVASDLAQPPAAQSQAPVESPAVPPAAETAPLPSTAPALDAPAPPRSALALAASPRPQLRPDDLIEAFNRRVAESRAAEAAEEAARQAAAEAARAEAEALARAEAERQAEERRRAEAAEAERREAAERQAEERRRAEAAEAERREAAERDAEERRRAEAAEAERREAAEREAEERRRAEAAEAERREAAERQAEERRRAEAAEAERREAAEREAEERRRAEAAEAERLAAEREAADRRALEDALREAQQNDAGAAGTDTASTGDAFGGDRQRIEGGDGASAGLDPLAAALAGALSGDGGEAPAPDVMQFAPSGISATPLPDPQDDAALGGLPVGAPLSLAEREGLRMAIERCWNVGALSVEAAQTSVTVAFSLGPDGVPEQGSMRIADFRGGSSNAAQQAFDVARRAILMCGQAGYALPAAKYGRWRDVEVSFRPGGVEF